MPERVTVLTGDTLYSIAQRYNLPVRALIDANHLTAPYQLTPGQVLALPGRRVHKVAKGDTLQGIAKSYKLDMGNLARANGLKPPYTIFAGQDLILPSSARSPATKEPTDERTKVGEILAIASPNAPPQKATPSPASRSVNQKDRTAPPIAAAPPPAPPVATEKPAAAPVPASLSSPQPPALASGGFLWPVKGKVVSEFGVVGKGRQNDGINIAVAEGTPIQAAQSGVVVYAGNELKGFGNLILIKHADGWMTAYAHNSQLLVKRGDNVTRGQAIAKAGDTGDAPEPQLHFEIRKGARAVNPLDHLTDA